MSALQSTRSIVFKRLPPSLEVKEVISSLSSGRIHNITRDKNLVVNFLDSNSASRFTRDFLASPRATTSLKDVTIGYGNPSSLPVEILAAIGLKSASRAVRVSAKDAKEIPRDIQSFLETFGPIESFESDGHSAVVHFMSINTAMKALHSLRANEAYAGLDVNFDNDLETSSSTRIQDTPTDLVLTGLPKGTTTRGILRRIKAGLPSVDRELIRSIVYDGKKKAFINFLEPAAAKIVFQSFNSSKTSTGGVFVSWSRTPANSVTPSLRVAVGAGVSRTLIVSRLKDVRQLRHVLKESAQFGTVVDHPYNPTKKTVGIEFADIYSSLRAIERIRLGMEKFPAFVGTSISFASPSANLRPMLIGVNASSDKPTSKNPASGKSGKTLSSESPVAEATQAAEKSVEVSST